MRLPKLWTSNRRANRSGLTDHRCRPHLEALEDRSLPSVTITQVWAASDNDHDGWLGVAGDGNIWMYYGDSVSNLGMLRMTPSGVATLYDTHRGFASPEIGPDGNIWRGGGASPTMSFDRFNVFTAHIDSYYLQLPDDTELRGSWTFGPEGAAWGVLVENPDMDSRIYRFVRVSFVDGVPAGVGDVAVLETEPGQLAPFHGDFSNVVVGPDGNFWMGELRPDKQNSLILRVTPAGVITRYPLPLAGTYPENLIADGHGNIWFSEDRSFYPYDDTQLARITMDGTVTEFPNASHGFPSSLYWAAVGRDGNIWSAQSNQVGYLTSDGQYSVQGYLPTSGGIGGFTLGPDGNFYESIAYNGAPGIYRIAVDWGANGSAPVVSGGSVNGQSTIQTYASANGATRLTITPYRTAFTGGVRTASGDFNHDGYADIVTAPGPGVPAVIKIFNGLTGQEIRRIQAFQPSFTGGAYVAVGDVNHDGTPDIIVGTGPGAPPHVKVFSGLDGSLLDNFFAYTMQFTGGVRVAAADINGDGHADIIVGTGPGTVPHVKVFSGKDLSILRNFLAYTASFTGGIFVAAGDVNGDGTPDIITGTGVGVHGHVKVFSGIDNSLLQNFFVFSASFTGGVRVGYMADKQSGGGDILVASGPGKPGKIELLSGTSLDVLQSFSVPTTAGLFVGGS